MEFYIFYDACLCGALTAPSLEAIDIQDAADQICESLEMDSCERDKIMIGAADWAAD